MIHSSIGIYPDGTAKYNGVRSEDLASHILYNIKNRPGRALIIDGITLHNGCCDQDIISSIISKGHQPTEITIPYQ